jgi:GMP synthase-like glutamine amidotransferase
VKAALVRQHTQTGPPALLGDWLRARGIPVVLQRSWVGEPLPDPEEHSFVASLGSKYSPRDADVPAVAGEIELVERAVERDVPVLGLCFGGQMLAHVLGGRVEPAPVPELGWREIATDDPGLVPAGPWLEWHYERFCTPPGATELARTPDAPQAFVAGPHLGVQFHPESTPEIVARWASLDGERLDALGIADGAALAAAPPQRREAAAAAAFRLFDAFLARAGIDQHDMTQAGAAGGRRERR